MMLNIVEDINRNEYRFDFLLAIVALSTWLKLLFMFRLTHSFGPMFKILYQMTKDLVKFLVIWIVIMITFSCVAILAFAQVPTFRSLETSFIYFLISSLGAFDLTVFDQENFETVTE